MELPKLSVKAFSNLLRELGACSEAREWTQSKTSQTAFRRCERADWMLWLLARMVGKPGWLTHPQLVLVTCAAVEPSLSYIPQEETRPRLALEAARLWAHSPTEPNRQAAAAAADAAWSAWATVWAKTWAPARAAEAAAKAAYYGAIAATHAAWSVADARRAAEAVANARVAARAVKETKHCIADTIRRTIQDFQG